MQKSIQIVVLSLLFLVATSTLNAQRRGGNRGGNSEGFERTSPAVGELLPDVVAYDAQGNEFPLRSLKDNYSVIVFGCLT